MHDVYVDSAELLLTRKEGRLTCDVELHGRTVSFDNDHHKNADVLIKMPLDADQLVVEYLRKLEPKKRVALLQRAFDD